MNLAINAVSAKVGGAVTYLQNILPELTKQLAQEEASRLLVWCNGASPDNQLDLAGVEYRHAFAVGEERTQHANPLRRLWFDQIEFPKRLKADAVDVLFSSANFGLLRRSCGQTLLVRNTVPFDEAYLKRMPIKVRAVCLLQRWLILQSIAASSVVVFPSEAMLNLVAKFTGGRKDNWQVSHFGARHDLFYPQSSRQPSINETIRLLHVSFYCDQKNLGTLLRAVQKLHQNQPRKYLLQLTAGFHQDWLGDLPITPNFRAEQALYKSLESQGAAQDVDWKAYGSLPDLYRAADIFVFPSYTESFGHPLIEAMSSGLPIIASDIPVNRELCGEAAVYCPPFDALAWADTIQNVSADIALQLKLREVALQRSKMFTWEKHVATLMHSFKQIRV